jgi:hypothetical protein
MDEIVLSPPSVLSSLGVCNVDSFAIISSSSQGSQVPAVVPPILCGVMSGNHSKLFSIFLHRN